MVVVVVGDGDVVVVSVELALVEPGVVGSRTTACVERGPKKPCSPTALVKPTTMAPSKEIVRLTLFSSQML